MPKRSIPRNPLLTKAYRVTDQLLDTLEHLPGGYAFLWGSLPRKGRGNVKAVRKQWVDQICAGMLPEAFLDMVLSAVILPTGSPNPSVGKLFDWLLANRYNNNVQVMYSDWLVKTKKGT